MFRNALKAIFIMYRIKDAIIALLHAFNAQILRTVANALKGLLITSQIINVLILVRMDSIKLFY